MTTYIDVPNAAVTCADSIQLNFLQISARFFICISISLIPDLSTKNHNLERVWDQLMTVLHISLAGLKLPEMSHLLAFLYPNPLPC